MLNLVNKIRDNQPKGFLQATMYYICLTSVLVGAGWLGAKIVASIIG